MSRTMETVTEVSALRTLRHGLSGSLAFVPTMGALHEGHLSLVRRGLKLADHVIVSIFVNPTQFAPHEDLEKYPRPIERDLQLCRAEGVTAVFNPSVDAVYPQGAPAVAINVPAIADQLEGSHRPQFFPGVCRVCAKLFNMVQPEIACFGRKDFQQLKVVEAMVADLAMPMRIEPCPIVREADGLAASSRNVYLSGDDRARATCLYQALTEARASCEAGAGDPGTIEQAMLEALESAGAEVDYAVVRDAADLSVVDRLGGDRPAVGLIAARIGPVRLIDNMLLTGGND